MNAIAETRAIRVSGYRALPAYLLEARYEFLRLLRTPSFAVPTLSFPPLFFLLFGLLLNHGNAGAAHYLFATYSVFGVMAPSLFGFGVAVAIEREKGWLALKRVAPMPPGAYLAAKLAMAMLCAAIIYLILAAMAYALGGVRLPAAQWLVLGTVAVGGALPMCALGLIIGSRANASAAPAFVNLIYLPMSFLSGLWMPLSMLPHFLQQVAPLWPAWHLGQLALMTTGQATTGSVAGHLLWLGAFTVICFAIARRGLAR
ncbi:MAG: ABC transporter permease, partial [Xanthomonadaceae bacterium]|nr:ABC transporter permease [Xanthomonadaceae bacterium]